MRRLALLSLVSGLIAGCGSDSEDVVDASPPPPDGATVIDAAPPDANGVPDASTLQPIGATCIADPQCGGGMCLVPTQGFPGGYCTAFSCDVANPDTSCLGFGGDGLCLDVGDPGAPFGICFDRCDPAASDCRSGYECLDIGGGDGICYPIPVCGNDILEGGEECEPPNTATCDANCQGVGTAAIGAMCTAATDCAGDFCIPDADGWPMGYCIQRACDLGNPATSCLPYGGDGLCIDIGDPGAPFGVCFDQCDPAGTDCRTGYECTPVGGGQGVCTPTPVCGNGVVEDGEECEPPNTATCDASCQGIGTAPIGAMCTAATDCAGDFCIPDADGWPMGYCVQRACDLANPDTSCLPYGGDGLCIDIGDPGAPFGICFDQCDPAGTDCRTGYECTPVGGGQGICTPTPVCGNGVVEDGEECEPPNTATCDASCQGRGTAAIGAMCTAGTDCAGDFCIPDADGWPMGYCIQRDCDLANPTTSCLPYGGDGLCLDVGDPGAPFGICFDQCNPAGTDCRTGYECSPVGGGQGVCTPIPVCGNGLVETGEECEPPGTATCDANCQGLGTAPVGDMCTSAGDCAGNFCIADADGWPGGYCSQLPCDLAQPTTSCLPYGGNGLCVDSGGGNGICLDQCSTGGGPGSDPCRPMYQCQRLGGGGAPSVCVP